MKNIVIFVLYVALFIFYFIGSYIVFNKINFNFNIFVNDLNFIFDIFLYIFVFLLFPYLIGGSRAFKIYFFLLLVMDIVLICFLIM
jgi:hypothetical protein